ncbi:MAG: hypothetical protein KIC77_09540, partial [Clostridiales bacterium]|nr:hypothetical protein [Clostridiales bacterium]
NMVKTTRILPDFRRTLRFIGNMIPHHKSLPLRIKLYRYYITKNRQNQLKFNWKICQKFTFYLATTSKVKTHGIHRKSSKKTPLLHHPFPLFTNPLSRE